MYNIYNSPNNFNNRKINTEIRNNNYYTNKMIDEKINDTDIYLEMIYKNIMKTDKDKINIFKLRQLTKEYKDNITKEINRSTHNKEIYAKQFIELFKNISISKYNKKSEIAQLNYEILMYRFLYFIILFSRYNYNATREKSATIMEYINGKNNQIENAFFNIQKDLEKDKNFIEKIYNIIAKYTENYYLNIFGLSFKYPSTTGIYNTGIYKKNKIESNIYSKKYADTINKIREKRMENSKLIDKLKDYFRDSQIRFLENICKGEIGDYIFKVCEDCKNFTEDDIIFTDMNIIRKQKNLIKQTIEKVYELTITLTSGKSSFDFFDDDNSLRKILFKLQKQISIIYSIMYLYHNKHSEFDDNSTKNILVEITEIIYNKMNICLSGYINNYNVILSEIENAEKLIYKILRKQIHEKKENIINNLDRNCYLNITEGTQFKIFKDQYYLMKVCTMENIGDLIKYLNNEFEKLIIYAPMTPERSKIKKLIDIENKKTIDKYYDTYYGRFMNDEYALDKIIYSYLFIALNQDDELMKEITNIDNVEKDRNYDRLLEIIMNHIIHPRQIENNAKGLNFNQAMYFDKYYGDKYMKNVRFRDFIDKMIRKLDEKKALEIKKDNNKNEFDKDKEAIENLKENLCDIHNAYVDVIVKNMYYDKYRYRYTYGYNLKLMANNCFNILDNYVINGNDRYNDYLNKTIRIIFSRIIEDTNKLIYQYERSCNEHRIDFARKIRDMELKENKKSRGNNYKIFSLQEDEYDIELYEKVYQYAQRVLSTIYSLLYLKYIKPHSMMKKRDLSIFADIIYDISNKYYKFKKNYDERNQRYDYNKKDPFEKINKYNEAMINIYNSIYKNLQFEENEEEEFKKIEPYLTIYVYNNGVDVSGGCYYFYRLIKSILFYKENYKNLRNHLMKKMAKTQWDVSMHEFANEDNWEIVDCELGPFYKKLYNFSEIELSKIKNKHYEKKYKLKEINLNELIYHILHYIEDVSEDYIYYYEDTDFMEKFMKSENIEKDRNSDFILEMFIDRLENINKERLLNSNKDLNEKNKYINIFTYYKNPTYLQKMDLDKIKKELQRDKNYKKHNWNYRGQKEFTEEDLKGVDKIFSKNDLILKEIDKLNSSKDNENLSMIKMMEIYDEGREKIREKYDKKLQWNITNVGKKYVENEDRGDDFVKTQGWKNDIDKIKIEDEDDRDLLGLIKYMEFKKPPYNK